LRRRVCFAPSSTRISGSMLVVSDATVTSGTARFSSGAIGWMINDGDVRKGFDALGED
jgi:hypothetical protein